MTDIEMTRRFEMLKGSSHEEYFKGTVSRLFEANEPQEQAHHYSVLHTILSTFKVEQSDAS